MPDIFWTLLLTFYLVLSGIGFVCLILAATTRSEGAPPRPKWTRVDMLTAIGVVFTILGILVAVFMQEIRALLGLR